MDNYIVFDLETTGYSPQSSEIIEIGAWKVKDNVAIEKYNTYIYPNVYIPVRVQELTGITMDKLNGAPRIEEIIPNFVEWCEDLPLLGHNLIFDYNFIVAKAKASCLDFSLGGTRAGIDTLKLLKQFYKGQFDCNKLEVVAPALGINLQSPDLTFHNAIFDSYMTKLVYDRIKMDYPASYTVNTATSIIKPDTSVGKVVNNEVLPLD